MLNNERDIYDIHNLSILLNINVNCINISENVNKSLILNIELLLIFSIIIIRDVIF